jgi:hypothetical protein
MSTSTSTSTNIPIGDMNPEMINKIKQDIISLQGEIKKIKEQTDSTKSTKIPDLNLFKQDIQHIITTIDNAVASGNNTPLEIYLKSLIKDMSINPNIYYTQNDQNNIISSLRLKSEYDILKMFKGFNVITQKIINVLDELKISSENDIKAAFKDIDNTLSL